MKTFVYVVVLQLLLLPAHFALAQGSGQRAPQGSGQSGGSVTIPNPLRVDSIAGLFKLLLDILIIFAIPIVAFFIIYAGFLYVTARGNTEQVSKAHRALLYAVIGGLLILGASVLIDIIQGTVDAVRR